MCTKQTIYKPIASKKASITTIAPNAYITNLQRVSYMTDTLVMLANRLEMPLGVVVGKLQSKQIMPMFYTMQQEAKLSQRQMVNRMAKAIAQ